MIVGQSATSVWACIYVQPMIGLLIGLNQHSGRANTSAALFGYEQWFNMTFRIQTRNEPKRRMFIFTYTHTHTRSLKPSKGDIGYSKITWYENWNISCDLRVLQIMLLADRVFPWSIINGWLSVAVERLSFPPPPPPTPPTPPHPPPPPLPTMYG